MSDHDSASDVSFGAWIQQRRKALDLTQDELARRVGCSPSAIRKIESDERRPSRQVAELLAEHLRIPPDQREVFLQVARAQLRVERLASPALIDRPVPIHHLPVPPTPLVGREPELAALERLLLDPQCRLLTLLGPGGIGKTRLAIEAASRHQALYPDGACFVSLAPLSSSELMVPAIADALGFAFQGQIEPRVQLLNILRDRQALLVLDNVEHLLDGVGLFAEMLERAPKVNLLVTSRERLNLHGEWTFEVQGLPVPPIDQAGQADEYSAIALFVQSARRAQAGFELSAEERASATRICQLVEGMPLGIELAAAWVPVLSCREIAREIERGLDFLATSLRDVPERQRSLRAAFEHSWRLLSVDERDVLRRLGVIQGGFDRAAAEQVAGATLPLLSALVAKSLIRRTQDGRYDLHEVIRQYALARLDEDESCRVEPRDRHSEYYLYLAAGYERKLKSASQRSAMRDMTLELDNIRAAWEWAIKRGKPESIGRAVRSFGWYFEVAGLIYDGIDQLELLVQALRVTPRDTQVDRVLGAALVQQGLLCFRSGHFAQAQERYRDAIALLRSVNEQALLADVLIFNGVITHLDGDYLEAKKLISEGLAYAQATNDAWFAAYGIYNLGHVDSRMGEYQKGYDQMQEGLRLWRELGDPHSISLGLNFLVETQIALGRHEEAIASMRESIALSERTKNRWGLGTAYRYLGLATLAAGQYAEAQGYLQKSLEIFGEYFKGWDIARTLVYLGEATLAAGDPCEAKRIFRDALREASNVQSVPLALDALVGLASLQAQAGEAEQALELSLCVLNHIAATQYTKDRAERLRGELESHLPPQQIEAARLRRQPRTFGAVVVEILTRDAR
jgi:predicted ATPase/DNA-binding XRE family transcriptional regulator